MSFLGTNRLTSGLLWFVSSSSISVGGSVSSSQQGVSGSCETVHEGVTFFYESCSLLRYRWLGNVDLQAAVLLGFVTYQVPHLLERCWTLAAV